MSQDTAKVPPFAVDNAMIDEVVAALDIAGRLEGRKGILLLDVAVPRAGIEPGLAFLADAAVGLHRQTQDDDDLSDIEEAIEAPLKAGDQAGVDEACDLYRGMLASRLKAILLRSDARERLIALQAAGARP